MRNQKKTTLLSARATQAATLCIFDMRLLISLLIRINRNRGKFLRNISIEAPIKDIACMKPTGRSINKREMNVGVCAMPDIPHFRPLLSISREFTSYSAVRKRYLSTRFA